MGGHPLGIGLEGLDEICERAVEAPVGVEREPIVAGGRSGHRLRVDLAVVNRDDALVVLRRVGELASAYLRRDSLGAEDEDESARVLDRPVDLGHPVGARADALPVDPGVLAGPLERIMELPDEVGVPAGVGDEDVAHGTRPPHATVAGAGGGPRILWAW